MISFFLARKRYAEEAAVAAGISLPFQPEKADDGFCGGRVQNVVRYFREMIRVAAEFGLKYDLSQNTVYLLSSDNFSRDISGFQEVGIQIRTDCIMQMMKMPGSGRKTFINGFYEIRKE